MSKEVQAVHIIEVDVVAHVEVPEPRQHLTTATNRQTGSRPLNEHHDARLCCIVLQGCVAAESKRRAIGVGQL